MSFDERNQQLAPGDISGGIRHPLQPLSPEEIKECVAAIRVQCADKLSSDIMFASIRLVEQSKEVVWAFEAAVREGKSYTDIKFNREAMLIIMDKQSVKTYEVIVSLNNGVARVVLLVAVPGVQPPFVAGEYESCEEIVKSDPEFLRICKERGIDVKNVIVECWASGWFGPEDNANRRLVRPLLYYRSRDHPQSNAFGRPLDNICPVVDMIAKKVVRIHDSNKSHIPVPPGNDPLAEFGQAFIPREEMRPPLKPLHIVQPEGPSFTVDGYHVKWQGFSFRVGFTQREGLVIHNVQYTPPSRPKDPPRSIVYRMSFSEMVVPYGDPLPPNVRKNAFDAGEDGLGNSANSLKLGCDCVGEIQYFDAYILDYLGRVLEIKNAVCLHEEDDGILWKHKDWRTGYTETRRNRKLVVSFFATISNYDYGFYYSFHLDGTINFDVKLTGILSTSALHPADTNPKYGTLISPGLNAPIHQHFFTARLDMAIDGAKNRVQEVEVRSETIGKHNPRRNAFYAVKTLIASEHEAGRLADSRKGRFWVIESSNRKNRMGGATGYRLMPAQSVVPFAHPTSRIMQRASFLSKNIWITATRGYDTFISGSYPNQRAESDGVAEWVKQNRSLVDEDITIWYTLGITHVVAIEAWPVMPVEKLNFSLAPIGFFDCNPTLDLPPEEDKGSHCAGNTTYCLNPGGATVATHGAVMANATAGAATASAVVPVPASASGAVAVSPNKCCDEKKSEALLPSKL